MNAPTGDLPNILSPDPRRFPQAREELARRLRSRELTVLPGVTDPLTARLAEQAGFPACYATGAGIANVQYGIADVGLLGLDEVVHVVRRLSDAVALPVVVDADTGYGGPLSVMRTVHMLEAAGAAAIQLEDQAMPKRCGHFDRHRLVDSAEMAAKVRAAVAARADDNTLIIGRTDALGVLGIDEAIRRGHDYLAAGADVLFVEAPHTIGQLERIGREFTGVPLVANMVEGGRTPQLSASELGELGYSVIVFANLLMRIMAKAAQSALSILHDTGDSRSLVNAMLSWSERQQLVELDRFTALERDFDVAADASPDKAVSS
jgi:2-methylisocitrate lyase-like PEP mutase family enzyme